MATGVGLAQISIAQIQPQIDGNFLLKFSNFRCHGANFNSTVKFVDPDNPLLGAGMGVVCPIQAESLPIFC